MISGLERNTYYARIILDVDGETIEIDSRPSDAIALAVRVDAPIYVAEDVMEQAGLQPEEELSLTDDMQGSDIGPGDDVDKDLGAFTDFVEGLDLDNLLGN